MAGVPVKTSENRKIKALAEKIAHAADNFSECIHYIAHHMLGSFPASRPLEPG
jgi:hypothetical protein